MPLAAYVRTMSLAPLYGRHVRSSARPPIAVEPAWHATPEFVRLFTAMRSAAEAYIPGSHSNANSVQIVHEGALPDHIVATFSLGWQFSQPLMNGVPAGPAVVTGTTGVVTIRESTARLLVDIERGLIPSDPAEYESRLGEVRRAAWAIYHEFNHSLTTLGDAARVADWKAADADPSLRRFHEGATDLLTEVGFDRWLVACGLAARHPRLVDGSIPLRHAEIGPGAGVSLSVIGNPGERAFLRQIVGLTDGKNSVGSWAAQFVVGEHAKARQTIARDIARAQARTTRSAGKVDDAIREGLDNSIAESFGAIQSAAQTGANTAVTLRGGRSSVRRVEVQCRVDRAVERQLAAGLTANAVAAAERVRVAAGAPRRRLLG